MLRRGQRSTGLRRIGVYDGSIGGTTGRRPTPCGLPRRRGRAWLARGCASRAGPALRRYGAAARRQKRGDATAQRVSMPRRAAGRAVPAVARDMDVPARGMLSCTEGAGAALALNGGATVAPRCAVPPVPRRAAGRAGMGYRPICTHEKPRGGGGAVDRPLQSRGHCSLQSEWGESSCCVAGHCSLIGACSLRSNTHNAHQGFIRKEVN